MPDVLTLVGWNQLVAVLLGAAVWLACRTPMLSRRPAVCHALWLLVLVKFIAPPIVWAPARPMIAAEAPASSAIVVQAPPYGCPCPNTAAGVAAGTLVDGDAPRDARRWTWRTTRSALLGTSLVVTGALWIVAARQFFQMKRLLGRSPVATGRATELLQEVCERFMMPSAVKLRMIDASFTPLLWAAPGDATIVLPRHLANSLSDDQLRSIFAHELAHFVRRDGWVNLFALSVTSLFWWNPLVWFAQRQLSAAAEACCDALALERVAGSRRLYAETLLTVVDSLTSPAPTTAPRRSTLGIAFGESHSLKQRFELIADARVKARMTVGGWGLLAIGFVGLTFLQVRAQEIRPTAASLPSEPAPQAIREAGADTPILPSVGGDGRLSTACCSS